MEVEAEVCAVFLLEGTRPEECGSIAVGKGKEQNVPSSLPGGKPPADTLTFVLTNPFLVSRAVRH